MYNPFCFKIDIKGVLMKRTMILPILGMIGMLGLGGVAISYAAPATTPDAMSADNNKKINKEKRAEFGNIIREYAPKIERIHDMIIVKQMELEALSHNPNATVKDISNCARAIEALMDEARALKKSQHERMENVAGHPLPPMPGDRFPIGFHRNSNFGCGNFGCPPPPPPPFKRHGMDMMDGKYPQMGGYPAMPRPDRPRHMQRPPMDRPMPPAEKPMPEKPMPKPENNPGGNS